MFKEQRRQAYLQAMGIQVYYPRRPLAGAGPSPHYQLPPAEAVAAPVAAPRVRPRQPQVAPARPRPAEAGQARALLAEAEQKKSPPRKPVARKQAESLPASSATAPQLRFLLTYRQVDARLAVLSELPFDAGNQAQAQAEQLQSAMVRALGISAEASGRVERFAWPLLPDLAGGGDETEQARQALAGFIVNCRERDGFSNLLVLSAQIDGLVPGADLSKESRRDYAVAQGGYHLTLTHSLHAMLAMPERKREAWQHLQALRQRLQ